MRLARPTTRRLMAAVAVAGVVMGTLAERRTRFLRLAHHHKAKSIEIQKDLAGRDRIEYPFLQALWHMQTGWHYERAARRPWLPVLPRPAAAGVN